MNCTNCGVTLGESEKFCSNCGAPAPAGDTPAADTHSMLGLAVITGPGVGRSFQLGEVTRIGRGADSDVRLFDPEVSREHAAVYRYDQGFAIDDRGSANGTFLNGSRLAEPAWIQPGDVIRMGRVEMQVTAPGVPLVKRRAVSGATAPPEPVADAGLPAWLLWTLMGFGMLLAAFGVVGLVVVLQNL